MKCNAFATQEAIHINEIREPQSSTQGRNAPVQIVLQRSLWANWAIIYKHLPLALNIRGK
ncbi:MAG: hypothetical protein ORN21_04305 [Methylophilaceae bacterium]|nr:hypothetical protein [Methylophilaceae bacterium]